jgi:cytochrome c biogenesis protein CcmG, thiol:disulfide interchange protein DsbE
MMRRLLFILPVLVFAGIVGYFALGLTRDPSTLPSALVGHPAPEFALPGLGDHQGFATADLKGQVTLVNFFASWCVPCRSEHPMLMRLAEEGKVRLLGVAYKDDPAASTKFLEQLGDPYKRIAVDRDGRVAIDFGVYGVPETYVVDKDGRIRYRQVGPLSPADWADKVAPLLKELAKS